ncbi:MAG: ABC transporter permease [Candidatus Bipolaricaulaceae bacterium]
MGFWAVFAELRRHPSAMVGLVIIFLLLVMSIYAVIRIPYSEAVRLWRAGEVVWLENPRNAAPKWYNWFGAGLPETIKIETAAAERTEERVGESTKRVTYRLAFDFPYKRFPQELALFFTSTYTTVPPQLVLSWRTPDGREIPLGTRTVRGVERYVLSGDSTLLRRLGRAPEESLFSDPKNPEQALSGRYELVMDVYTFEPGASLSAKFIVYGRVYGWAGTDHLRRDLSIGLLWGAPIAVAFGFTAAVGIALIQFILSGIGAWFGGALDILIDRLTELRMILPLLPILILVGMLWSRSIWVILATLLMYGSIGGYKTYRAMFLQAREAPYIEAAKAYGAGNFRIVFRYLLPRLIPVLIPSFVLAIPDYVFLEASLAVLGIGDPILPTWGKIINDAYSMGAQFKGLYYWLLEPAALLMITGLGFAMIGFTLDRIFNPRLRSL